MNNRRVRDTVAAIRAELTHDRAYLLPLRIFIGLGWLRAAVAKATDPGWYDGSELTIFLEAQLGWSQEAFPFYGTLMEAVFLPNAALLGIVVILLQLFAGVAIVAGYHTHAGLLVGLMLNVNFILAGRPDPSAFYIVIQLVLLFGGAGAVLGLDASRWRRHDHPLLVSSIDDVATDGAHERHGYALLAGVSVVLAAMMAPYISTLDPATVVEDPAMVLVMLALFAAGAATIRAVGGSRSSAATSSATSAAVSQRLM